jgi:hypothetical protein
MKLTPGKSSFGPDPSRYHHGIQNAGITAAGAISAALAVGLVNAMNARALADGRAITIREWEATVHLLEMHCQKFDADGKRKDAAIRKLSLEILQLRAQYGIAQYRASVRGPRC